MSAKLNYEMSTLLNNEMPAKLNHEMSTLLNVICVFYVIKKKFVLQMVPKKTCNKCKEEKPLTGFYKSKTAKDGLQHYCKN
jgi:hypothetical protein